MNTKRILTVLILAIAVAAIQFTSHAQYMKIQLNDQGSSPQAGEHYYIQIDYVEVLNNGIVISTIPIASGANQDFGSATAYYPDQEIPCYFTANVPYDVTAKIYRVKFRLIRDEYPPSAPYVASGTNYSEECNSEMFYAVSGFDASGDLN